MQKEKVDIKVTVSKVCPTCSREFDSTDECLKCPHDNSLLCPVDLNNRQGEMVDDYEIVEEIGRGSSGSVYLARHKEFKKEVAIKILNMSMSSDPAAVKRFQLEAQAISEIDCSEIASVYDYGVLPDGKPYLVMEYVEGKTLAEVLKENDHIGLDEADKYFKQLAGALSLAHQKGIFHRDIKPSNLIVGQDGSIRIVDFGLAKIIGLEANVTLTRTGDTLGTPAYMSPEQISGKMVDERSDIYSLGCVMFEILTGKKVFQSENAFDFMHKHSFEIPCAPSKYRKIVSGQLDQVILKCLAKKPEDRFQTLGELIEALGGKPVVSEYTLKTRSRTAFKLLGALSMIVICGIVMAMICLAAVLIMRGPIVIQDRINHTPAPVQFQSRENESINRLTGQFEDIEKQIKIRRDSGSVKIAEKWQRKLDKFKSMMTGSYPIPSKKVTEIHAVGVYQGNVRSPEGKHHPLLAHVPGTATANIDYQGNPITLLLTAYEPVDWTVNVAKGTTVSKIILSGYHDQTIKELNGSTIKPEVVKVEKNTFTYDLSYDFGYGDYLKLSNGMKKQNGAELTSLIGDYSSKINFDVSPMNKNWRAQHVSWRMKDFYDEVMKEQKKQLIAKLRRTKIEGVSIRGNFLKMNRLVGNVSPYAPKDAKLSKLEFPANAAVLDKSSGTWWMVDSHSIANIKEGKSGINYVNVPIYMASPSWISGIAFDTKRSEVNVITARGSLYKFNTKAKNWKLLRSSGIHVPNSGDVKALSYSQKEDSLFCLLYGVDNTAYSIGRINSNDEFRDFKLLTPITASQHAKFQLMVEEEHFTVLATDEHNESMGLTTTAYVFDKETGRLVLSKVVYDSKGPSAPVHPKFRAIQ